MEVNYREVRIEEVRNPRVLECAPFCRSLAAQDLLVGKHDPVVHIYYDIKRIAITVDYKKL